MTVGGKFFSLLFLVVGLFLLLQVSLPLLNYKVWEHNNIVETSLLTSPQTGSQQVLGVSIEKTDSDFPAIISSLQRETRAPYDRFFLSVPSIKLDRIEVFVDSNNLNKGLSHLPGSALPGERGNAFISGHSALPLIPISSKAYFADLTKLKKGDQIQLQTESNIFNYLVLGIKVIDPTDVSIILPPDSFNRYITLMTCVPPGLNTKRLVVLGKLI